jgi:hypothetical protein
MAGALLRTGLHSPIGLLTRPVQKVRSGSMAAARRCAESQQKQGNCAAPAREQAQARSGPTRPVDADQRRANAQKIMHVVCAVGPIHWRHLGCNTAARAMKITNFISYVHTHARTRCRPPVVDVFGCHFSFCSYCCYWQSRVCLNAYNE